jgi:oxygen-independent coproporphyrinogen-3 oxidase
MAPETAAALVAKRGRCSTRRRRLEVTLEANPTSCGARSAGGVPRGRGQPLVARRAVAGRGGAALPRRPARRGGGGGGAGGARALFPRLSFDLIYARPGQSEAAWRTELRRALALAADHLSLYQLTIEPGTRFATEHARGAFVLPADDDAARLYTATAEEAERFGLLPYEVSNYARPGAESRHNLQYWRYGDYLGVGPGAHQRLSADGALLAARRHRAPEEWLARVERDGHAVTAEEALAPQDRMREALLMGLRLAEGVDTARLEARCGMPFADGVDPAMLAACEEEGYLEWPSGGRLRATADGRLRLDAMLPVLLR